MTVAIQEKVLKISARDLHNSARRPILLVVVAELHSPCDPQTVDAAGWLAEYKSFVHKVEAETLHCLNEGGANSQRITCTTHREPLVPLGELAL